MRRSRNDACSTVCHRWGEQKNYNAITKMEPQDSHLEICQQIGLCRDLLSFCSVNHGHKLNGVDCCKAFLRNKGVTGPPIPETLRDCGEICRAWEQANFVHSITIFVRIPWQNNKILTITLPPEMPVSQLKLYLQQTLNIKRDRQVLSKTQHIPMRINLHQARIHKFDDAQTMRDLSKESRVILYYTNE